MIIEAGQVWQYEDDRTGWKHLVVLLCCRETNSGLLSELFDAFVLDWDRDYEFEHMILGIARWELRTYYTRVA